jgi:NAD(P)-dependent dehydrogenase (short-subunit alcohol dehydrogenase family)
VELFLREGAQVVAADIQDDKGALLVDELGPSVSYFSADVGEEHDVEALVADTVKRHGRLDCLFNNAGLGGVSGPITWLQVVRR